MKYKRKRGKSPPRDGSTYKHKDKIAAVLVTGVAAIFLSTNYYVIVCFLGYYNGVFPYSTVDLTILCILFNQTWDKPCFNPGCRSPPPIFEFS